MSLQINEIGEFFTVQLLESRHRGAFELAYAGFIKMTEMLWRFVLHKIFYLTNEMSSTKVIFTYLATVLCRCRVSAVNGLPSQWLEEVMQDIRSCDPNSRLCATRRSAGVPFYVQVYTSLCAI